MPKIKKAYAISDAKIGFVSLVDKAANRKKFLIAKAGEPGRRNFMSQGRIIKADAGSHYVTGIVYEPMVEDSQGNYMTEDEITKAAHWFAKNGNSVDIQHCFEKCENVAVVESYVAKCDMEIEGQAVKKGTWLMTAEVTDDDLWDSIQKGEITGFSMGGVGVYSDEDVDLGSEGKTDDSADKPEGLLKKLAKAFGLDVVEKGAVKDNFVRRVKSDNFYSAWYALQNALEGHFYNPNTDMWEYGYNSDETVIKEALKDFNDIVTQLLTSDGSIVKSLEKSAKEAPKGVLKAGKSLSTKNMNTLRGIYDTLGSFLSEFEEGEPGTDNEVKKEDDTDMKQEEVQEMVNEAVTNAMEPVITQLMDAVKTLVGDEGGEGGAAAGDKDAAGADASAETVAKMVGEEVAKAMEPVMETLQPIMRSRALPGNLNGVEDPNVAKSEESHYMTGMY